MSYFILQIKLPDDMEYDEVGSMVRTVGRTLDGLSNTDDNADGEVIRDALGVERGEWWFSESPCVPAKDNILLDALRDIVNASRDEGLAAMCNWMRGRAATAVTEWYRSS